MTLGRLVVSWVLLSAGLMAQPNQQQRKQYPIAVWLIPAERQNSSLEQSLWQIADVNHIPRFRPHVTLIRTPEGNGIPDLRESLETLLGAVDRFAATHDPLTLTATEHHPKTSDEPKDWSTSVILPFSLDSKTERFFSDADAAFRPQLTAQRDRNGNLIPHLSLAYVDTVGPRARIADQFASRIPDTVDIDTVAVAMPRSGNWHDIFKQPLRDPKDDAAWVVIYSRRLGTPHVVAEAAPLSLILVGGQIGTDQAAYRAAQQTGILAFGWMPPGRETNRRLRTDPIPKDILLWAARSRNSDRTPDIARSARTALNTRDAEGVLIVGGYGSRDSGTVATVAYAHDYGKPIHYVDPSATDPDAEIKGTIEWLQSNRISVLNVAGATKPNTYEFLLHLFREATHGRRDAENFGQPNSRFP